MVGQLRAWPLGPAALASVALAACGGGSDPHSVQTRAHAVSSTDPAAQACLRLLRQPVDTRLAQGVERAGAAGRSVTLRIGVRVLGCDAPAAPGGRWCAGAVGTIRRGHLADPRLTLTCRDDRGRTLGFAWIEPVAGARSIVVRRSDARTDGYPVIGTVPVRVATGRISVDSAVFEVAQYDAGGRRLEQRRLVARVSG
jgi:hypothetical protein